jgi:hypothetical protein
MVAVWPAGAVQGAAAGSHVLGAHDGQAVGLPEVRGDLGDELVRADAQRGREALAGENDLKGTLIRDWRRKQ